MNKCKKKIRFHVLFSQHIEYYKMVLTNPNSQLTFTCSIKTLEKGVKYIEHSSSPPTLTF